MRQGLFQGLNQGLKQGLNSEFGTLIPVYDFDFRTPVAQSFPTTAAALASLLGDASAAASAIYTCQETSGDLLDQVGSVDLTASGSPLQGQGAYGIGDYTTRKAVEFSENSTETFAASSTASLDSDGTAIAVVAVVRGRTTPGGTRSILGKRVGNGWELLTGAGGNFAFAWAGASGTQQAATSTGTALDGAWHCVIAGYSVTNDTTYLYSDLGSATDTTPASPGSTTNAAAFSIGKGNTNAADSQVAYCAVFEGAAAEALLALGATAVTNFWTHGSDPTGLLTTQTRASLISVPVAADKVGHFTDDTLPIGYHSALNSGSGGFGLYSNNAVTNSIPYSEQYTVADWNTSLNLTASDNAGDAPDGFRSSGSLTATAADGRVETGTIAASNDQTWTYSVWIKRNGGSDVAGKISIRDVGNATSYDQAFTATSTWQLVSVTVTLPSSGVTNLRARIYVDTNTESIFAWGSQLNLGEGRGAYARTYGAASALVESDYRSTDKVPTDVGRVTCSAVLAMVPDTTKGYWDTEGTTDRRTVFVTTTNDAQAQLRDNLAAVWFNGASGVVPTADTLYETVCRWDIDAGDFPENASATATLHNNGTQASVDDTDTSSVSEAVRDMLVGRGYPTADSLDGYVERIRIYDAVGAEPS